MRTIVEAQRYTASLWGIPKGLEKVDFRAMRYVLRIHYKCGTFLYNVVTGQLVELEENEVEMFSRLPAKFTPIMEQLIEAHYLVPIDYNEQKAVSSLRRVFWRLQESQKSKDITYYTILITTACNARCYYCFEQGVKPATMSEKTADDVVSFIASHCGGKEITIRWFGGEPTIAINRIDQICEGLNKEGISFSSLLTTNGYSLDEKSISKAKKLWKLKFVTVSIDGTENTTNRIKAFVSSGDNPYSVIMRNVGLFLEQKISVGLRMNFNKENYEDFPRLLKEAYTRFGNNPYLQVTPHHINQCFGEEDDIDIEEWYSDKLFDFYSLAQKSGLYRNRAKLPRLFYHMCEAANDDAVTITPQGDLVSCGEQLGHDEVKGNLKQGVVNKAIVQDWKQFIDYDRCLCCELYPSCPSMLKCTGKDKCYYKKWKKSQYVKEILRTIELNNVQ